MRPNGGTAKQQGTPMEKVQKRGGGYKKNSTVDQNGKDYNGIENACVCSNISRSKKTNNRKEIEQINYAVTD